MTRSFDFVVGDPFRESLNTDYREMMTSFEHGAYKAAVVLAGSIIEALLVDYLVGNGHKDRTGKDPLTLTFAELVTVCRGEGIITSRTADLCSAVRSFRNLIHPGRSVRLSDTVDDASASVAKDLVRIVATEVAKKKRETYGLTAEQLLAKLERDESSLAILSHLMPELSTPERERLLLTVLPTEYLNLQEGPGDWNSFGHFMHRDRLTSCYRQVLATVPEDLRRTVARKFVRIIKEESESYIREYGDAFFRGTDIALLASNEAALVRAHLLETIGSGLTSSRLEVLAGIESTMQPDELENWFDPIIRYLTSDAPSPDSQKDVRALVAPAFTRMETDTQATFFKRIQVWRQHFTKRSEDSNLQLLKEIESDILATLL